MNTDFDKLILGEKFGITFEAEESIRMICKPNLKACCGNEIKTILSVYIFFAGSIGLFQIIAYLYKSTYNWYTTLIFLGIVSCISIGGAILTILKLRTTTYVITNLTIILHQDFYNASTKTVNIRDIKTKELKKTIIDKHFKTGTIRIFTGETKENDGKTEKVYDNIYSVFDSERTFALLQS